MYTNFKCCCLSFFAHHSLYFFLRFFNHLFDSCRMDSSIYDQTLQCNSCHFSSDWIKSGKNNCLRSIINNKLYSCQCLKSTNIPSLSSDNSTLHLVTWKLNYRDRSFSHMICRTSLDCGDNILFRLLVSLFLCTCFKLFHHLGSVMFHIFFNSF